VAANRRTGSSRPTLRDVAGLAGVSLKTASRVVNGEKGVVAAKVQAVERAVRQLDYRPDIAASSLRRADGRTAAVAALLEDLANPFSAEVHRALEDAARQRNVLIFAGSVDEDPERERQLVRAFTDRRADALVIVPASQDQAYLARAVPEGTPVIFVDRPPSGYAADAVVTDNADAAAAAVDHLAERGHRRIAFLGDLAKIATARDRFAGYARALAMRALPAPPHLAAYDLHSHPTAEAAVDRMLDGPDPPTALFTAQNNITVAAIRCLQRRGLESRVALVGFDDFPLAELLRPGVTVMTQDPTTIGRTAAEILFARLEGDTSPPRTAVVPTRLVVRGSGEIPPMLP
jgi:LacI family transcriptional regulator